MKKITLEICCGSVDDVIEAKLGGADRIELNSNMFHGGLTPSIGSLITAKKMTGMEMMCMVRPREGGFDYTEAEFLTMLEDARRLIEAGADGIVFGFLKEDGTLNLERCKAMMEVIGDKQSVFHRAIDVVPNWRSAIDQLCDLGVTRILTSGQNPSVYYGICQHQSAKPPPNQRPYCRALAEHRDDPPWSSDRSDTGRRDSRL